MESPMDSSSSSSTKCLATHQPNTPANFVSNCLLSSAFLRTPFSPPFPKPNSDCIYHLQKSLFTAVDGCFRTFNSFASTNPLLKKLLSFSSDLRNFHQINCRKHSTSNSLSIHNFAAILPGDSVASIVVANGISNFLNIYNTLLVVRLVLTWFPNSPPAIVSPLSTICDPYLNIFRGLIPPLGGTLDLSPILAFLVLNAFTSSAAALPAELPTTEVFQNHPSSQSTFLNHTVAQRKWMKRICGTCSSNSTGQSGQEN